MRANLLAESPAPWSPLARDSLPAGKAAIDGLASSAAQARLVSDIKRYVLGEVSGRAFLIAGLRGAGKTTAVLAAMQQVYNECQSDAQLSRFRPLLVRLHAPSLLVEPEAMGESALGTPSGAGKTVVESEDQAAKHSTRFLREMAAGIFPALVEELRRRLIQVVDERHGGVEGMAGERRALSEEHARAREMIAHLCDQLGRGMTIAEVRELFRRLGLLPGGLMGASTAFQELVAVQAASEAYLIVTGKLETQANVGQTANDKSAATESQGLDGEKLLKGLAPVAAALAAAVGIAKDSAGTGLLVAAGVLLSGFSLNWSMARERVHKAENSRTFRMDNSHASLVRRVPLLVEQLRLVGFPVVFVLDELDKLVQPPPQALLEWLLRNLKSYVTERSFLCFIVERDYYEKVFGFRATATPGVPAVASPGEKIPELYGVEHTFYSDAAYVIPTHAALHTYLRVVLKEDAVEDTTRRLNLATFRHVVLHRSKVHPYDLLRELRRAEESWEIGGIMSPTTPFRRPLSWGCAALIECGIEWVMSEPRLGRRTLEDPYFYQVAHDLLYKVSDEWRAGDQTDVNLEGIQGRVRKAKVAKTDEPLLQSALEGLLSFLKAPQSLLRAVGSETDTGRLVLYCVQGEQPASATAIANARKELRAPDPHGRDLEQLAKCFGTWKYQVLRSVTTGRSIRPLLGADGTWAMDPRGYLPGEAALAEEDVTRMNALVELQDRLLNEGHLRGLDFSSLWASSTHAGDLPLWSDVLAAHGATSASSQEREVIAEVERIADKALDACRLVILTLAALGIATKIRELNHAKTNLSYAALLPAVQRAIRGSELGTRVNSARALVRGLLDLYQASEIGLADLETTLSNLSTEGIAAACQTLANLNAGLTTSPDQNKLRDEWLELVAARLDTALTRATLATATEERSALLDLVASLNDWKATWASLVPPDQWTIATCSHALDDGDAPDWLRAVAAAKLGVRELAEQMLARSTPTQSVAVTRIFDWVKLQLELTTVELLRVLLVSPGPVMNPWLPTPGVRVVSVPFFDESVPQVAGNHLVFSEKEDARPSTLLPHQYVLVSPGAPNRSTNWQRSDDGGLTLFGPESLEVALRWRNEALLR